MTDERPLLYVGDDVLLDTLEQQYSRGEPVCWEYMWEVIQRGQERETELEKTNAELRAQLDAVVALATEYKHVVDHVAECGGTCHDCQTLARSALEHRNLADCYPVNIQRVLDEPDDLARAVLATELMAQITEKTNLLALIRRLAVNAAIDTGRYSYRHIAKTLGVSKARVGQMRTTPQGPVST